VVAIESEGIAGSEQFRTWCRALLVLGLALLEAGIVMLLLDYVPPLIHSAVGLAWFGVATFGLTVSGIAWSLSLLAPIRKHE
jgi:hypothetical protein